MCKYALLRSFQSTNFFLIFSVSVICTPIQYNISVSLPRGWIQEIKRMLLVHLTHGLFFNLNTQILIYYRSHLQYLHDNRCLVQSNPLLSTNPCLLTWKTNFFARGGEYQSTLVPGLRTTGPPFASPPTLSHPTVQVTLVTQTTSATPVVLV